MKCCRVLKGVDKLRIETRSHLDTHATKEQPDVHDTKIRFLVPWCLVLVDEAGNDGIGGGTNVDHGGGLTVGECNAMNAKGWAALPVTVSSRTVGRYWRETGDERFEWGHCRSYYIADVGVISPGIPG
jgi:hypothetical protein